MSANEVSGSEVLVVGAGPTGLTMAAELARRGVSCRIVDQAVAPSAQSRALAIQARTLEVFDIMGLVDPFLSQGWKAYGMNAHDGAKQIADIRFDKLEKETAYPLALILPQSDTERILADRLQDLGVKVERQTELTGLTQDNDSVSATLRRADGATETHRASWLIGCDGAHSVTRHALALPFEGAEYPERFLLADVEMRSTLSDAILHLYLTQKGLLAFIPMGKGRFRIIADAPSKTSAPAGANRSPEQPPTLAEVQALVDARGPGNVALLNASWIAVFHIHRRIVSKLRKGRVFLAGDAAHIHSPVGGQGMNTGIQDAMNLAWKIACVAKGAANPALLNSYQEERYPVEKEVLRETDLLTRIVSVHSAAGRYLRDHLLPLLTGTEMIQHSVTRSVAELNVNYRHSPIVEDHAYGKGPRAGDRAPEAALRLHEDANLERLLPLLRSGKHTLLLFSGYQSSAESPNLRGAATKVVERYSALIAPYFVASNVASTEERAGVARISDLSHALHDRFGVNAPGLYLIRPDGYIAFRGAAKDADAFFAYLAKLYH